MYENVNFLYKRRNYTETESRSFCFKYKICKAASDVMRDCCPISIRGLDFSDPYAFDYIECLEYQGQARYVPFLRTFGEFSLKDSKQNFKPTQKVTDKRHDGVADKIGHLLQTLFISQLISIVMVHSVKGISTKYPEILYVHVDSDLIIKTMETETKGQHIYVCLWPSTECFFAQDGLAVQFLQTCEPDAGFVKLDFLCEKMVRHLLKVDPGLLCNLQQLLLRIRSSKSRYLNVKRFSNNDSQTENDGKQKYKVGSRKPAASEHRIHCASPSQRVDQQRREKMNERICAQHNNSQKNKKSHSFGVFDEKQLMEQPGQQFHKSGSSAHKAAPAYYQVPISCEQEQCSKIDMNINLPVKSRLPERQSGYHFDVVADGGDCQGALGIKTSFQVLKTLVPQCLQSSPLRQTQSMPPPCMHQRGADLRRLMKGRNFRVASLVHLLPKDKLKDMADAGLYLDEQADLLCCPYCSLRVRRSQWPWEQRPEDVHRRQSPDCPAVNPAAHAGHAGLVSGRGTERGRVLSVGAKEQGHLSSLDEKEEKRECSSAASSMRDGEDEAIDVASERQEEEQTYTTSVEEKIKGQPDEAQEKAEVLFTVSGEDSELQNYSLHVPKTQELELIIPSNNDIQADCEAESGTSSFLSTGPDRPCS